MRPDRAAISARSESQFRDRITADGSSGFKAEAGRYHLYVAHNCPWAHRMLIYRAIKKLERADHGRLCHPRHARPGLDLRETIRTTRTARPTPSTASTTCTRPIRRATRATPARSRCRRLWDKKTQADRQQRVRPRSSACSTASSAGSPATTPTTIRRRCAPRSTRSTSAIYRDRQQRRLSLRLRASSQAAYEEAYDALFATLDELEARLARQRYLVGGRITEADWRLLPTLRALRRRLFLAVQVQQEARSPTIPNLSNYMRELYQVPGVAATVTPRYYVIGYYSITKLNPTGIIPKGTPVDLGQPHDRARLAA